MKEVVDVDTLQKIFTPTCMIIGLIHLNRFKKVTQIINHCVTVFHSNQIGFPGGRVEEYDKTLFDTAIRETFEEIGIIVEKDALIRELQEIYIP